MKCEQMEELIPDFIAGTLNTEGAAAVEEHIAECSRCAGEVEIWKKLALLPQEHPSPALRSRFDAMLESYQEGRWEKSSLASERQRFFGLSDLVHWIRTPSLSAGWACVLLLMGFLGGRYIDRDGTSGHNAQQLAELQAELHKTSALVAISLLQQQSASERLRGVEWSTRVTPDPQILDALQSTLRYDSSVDVRLAALDALGHYGHQPEVSRGLVDALGTQDSPLVQIALIDALVDLHESKAIESLKRLQAQPGVDPTVRKHADWGIRQLS